MNQAEIRIRELEIAVEANRTLLSMETEKANAAHQQLIKIGNELGGISFDAYIKDHSIDSLTPEELAAAIIGIVKVNIVSQNMDDGKILEMRHAVDEKDRLLDSHSKRADAAEETVRVLRKQIDALETDRSHLRQETQRLSTNLKSIEANEPGADFSVWIEEWKKHRGYPRDSEVLTLIGKYGWARTSKITQDGAGVINVSAQTIRRGLKDLENTGLINRQKGIPDIGCPTKLNLMTEKGRWTYSYLTGEVPLPSEYDGLLKAHKSNLQSILVLKAADQFTRLEFITDTRPNQIKISDNRFFDPDLIITKDGFTFYLELETGVGNNREELIYKWENAFIVGGGKICLITRDKATMSNISSNIVRWARENGKRIHLYATNLKSLKTKTITDSPWVIDKDR